MAAKMLFVNNILFGNTIVPAMVAYRLVNHIISCHIKMFIFQKSPIGAQKRVIRNAQKNDARQFFKQHAGADVEPNMSEKCLDWV